MTRYGDFEVHPGAELFPLVEGEEFDSLVQDIKLNGLRQPLVVNYDATVLIDGRNRWRACYEAGVDYVYEKLGTHYTDTHILDFIVSANLHRRHLNPGQKAAVSLELEALYAAAAKAAESERKQHRPDSINTVADPPQSSESEPKSREKAAKATGASARGVQTAKALKRDTPDLLEKVRSGEIAIDAADKERRRRVASQPKPDPVDAGPVMLTLVTHTGEQVPYPQPKSKSQFNRTAGEGISWAGWSWNPVTGCLHGCNYCYARELAVKPSYQGAYPVGFTPLFHHERLDAPANTPVPEGASAMDPSLQRVFVCSMADLYGRWVPDEWIEQVHRVCIDNPQWQYLHLTKFPSRYVDMKLPSTAWIGTSVDEQKRVRIAEEAFAKIDGVKVKWLSLEPLLEPLVFTDLSVFDWVVIGAQTETRQPTGTVPAFAPPFEWVARIVAQAREAGCKVHLKPNLVGQISGQLPGMTLPNEYPA